MTTKVTVDAHAGWPVKVDRLGKTTTETTIVPPNTVQDFYIHDEMDLFIREMKK